MDGCSCYNTTVIPDNANTRSYIPPEKGGRLAVVWPLYCLFAKCGEFFIYEKVAAFGRPR